MEVAPFISMAFQPRFTKLSPLCLAVCLSITAIVVALGCGRRQPVSLAPDPDSGSERKPAARSQQYRPEEEANIELVKKAAPSVVHITSVSVSQDAFSLDVTHVRRGTGSGIVWDDQGHIITNYHVVKGAQATQVILADHSSWKARHVLVDPASEIAVLQIGAEKSRLHPIPLGKSSTLQVGQYAFAIGNPFGLDHTVTRGIVSAVGREMESSTGRIIKGVVQTDAAINPGNSGGPLLDSNGRLIGINTAILTKSGGFAGIGLAIPADEANRVATQLLRTGKVVRPGLGIHEASDQVARRLQLPGVLILSVNPDGPAAKAGLKPTRRDDEGEISLGDAIVAVDGHKVKTLHELFTLLDKHAVGDEVTLTIVREGRELTKKVTLAAE